MEENSTVDELATLARRLEQQISAYEKLHVEEIKRFQEQFEAFQRIQTDELQMLRQQLAKLAEEITAVRGSILTSDGSLGIATSEPTLSRRDLLTGKLPPYRPPHHEE